MRSEPVLIEYVRARRVALLLRLAGFVSVISSLVGGYVWLVDLADRSDGDGLRYGFWHNPFMQFRPFNETLLDISMWVLFACSAAVGFGGLMLLVPLKWGVPLVTWQARVSIITNSVIAFFIVAMTFGFARTQLQDRALGLRLASIVVDVVLWTFLSSGAVSGFFAWRSDPRRYAGFCARCGYDLRGSTGPTCPECGEGQCNEHQPEMAITDPAAWAEKSKALAFTYAYGDGKLRGVSSQGRAKDAPPPPMLPADYEEKAKSVARMRVALAGVQAGGDDGAALSASLDETHLRRIGRYASGRIEPRPQCAYGV